MNATVHCMPAIRLVELNHSSPEFDAAYALISSGIAPEYLETRDFLRNRLRVRDEGPKTEKEKILVQDGYTLHLIAAVLARQAVGAIYGHLISKITSDNKAVGFVTYLAVHPEYRKRGIGTALIRGLHDIVDRQSLLHTGKPVFGMVYEIEEEGKEEIKATVNRLGAKPLDIVYYQPALRNGYEPERMNLWFQPVPALASLEAAGFALRADIVGAMVLTMLTMEYAGPEMKGFDLKSKPYSAFQDSISGRKKIGFIGQERL